jgi:multicomponent Na+:H+ antiporter subunit B
MIGEPKAWVLIGLGAILIALAVFALRARSLFAMTAMLATMALVLAGAMLALDAPDPALVAALVGVGIVAPLFLGAVSLTAKTAAPRKPGWLAAAVTAALAGLVLWACADVPEIGAKSLTAGAGAGVIYVNRALGESGLANAVMAVSANYRAIDSILAVCVLFVASLGAYGVLGFGERSALRRHPAQTLVETLAQNPAEIEERRE